MTPAETLREAARLMRERAQAATPGPWEKWHLVQEPDVDCWPVDACGPRFQRHVTDAAREADAEHIASWHPGVALAVADWLDTTALAIVNGQTTQDGGTLAFRALAVARAYLGVEL